MSAVLELEAAAYVPSELHSAQRCWMETNCYIDVWIELLHALGLPPGPIGVCGLSADFEGDQWVFFKVPPEDLRALYGIDVHEMNVWRPLPEHIEEQLAMGRLLTVEADSFYLPDTIGTAYGSQHVKTTIAPAMLDRGAQRMGYFHSSGYYELEGADYEGIFTPSGVGLPPYVELVRLDGLEREPGELLPSALALLRDHLARAPRNNPVLRLGERIRDDLPTLASSGVEYFHGYAFGTARQCGASAEMGASFVEWLDGETGDGLAPITDALLRVATDAKALELTLARAAHGRRVDISGPIDSMADAWASALDGLRSHYG